MIQIKKIFFIYVCLIIYLSKCNGTGTFCINDCSGKGKCSSWGSCICFNGYEGSDCSRKQCPKGYPLADVAIATDTAHQLATCSNQGSCNYNTGICNCNPGYAGTSCNRLGCFNGCSNHGNCISLREAATLNDGYEYNRTTTYTQWDADIFYGCQCEYGWSGADCSQRTCEYGADPRMEALTHEKVTMICSCSPGYCNGNNFNIITLIYLSLSYI